MKKRITSFAQLLLGVVVLVALLHGVNKSSTRVDFTVDTSDSFEPNSIYCIKGIDEATFTVIEVASDGSVGMLRTEGRGVQIPAQGDLMRSGGDLPVLIPYSSFEAYPYGRQLLWETCEGMASRWPFLIVGIGGFIICICLCVWRWRLLLAANAVFLRYRKLLGLYLIGQFFSAFLPGGTSGDLIKAYLVTKDVPDKKAEAVTTVFIDRIVGLFALILLSSVVMICRLDFFLAGSRTRIALFFIMALLVGSSVGLLMVFKQNIFERWRLFRRLERETRLGAVLRKAYDAFHLCFNERALLVKTLVISVLNQLMLMICIFFLGTSLDLQISFLDYLSVFPVIGAIGGIPITPGGLGAREGAAIYFLGDLGVHPAKALVVSLLFYGMMLFWSLVGAFVYLWHVRSQGKLPAVDLTGIDTP